MNFRHKIVNDLAWVIGSVPLMSFDHKLNRYHELDQAWFEQEFMRCNGFLKQLDNDPTDLEEFVNVEGRQLLGKRFEKFIEFWLDRSQRFKILLANEQLINSKGTLGEIDYVVEELESGRLYHFEVACKYYLSATNSKLWNNWVGLNARDTLAHKMTKFDKQLTIFQTEEGRALLQRQRLKTPESFLLMKGFFFYHWKQVRNAKAPKNSNPNHNTGIYLKLSECAEFFNSWSHWKVLKKENWFSPFVTQDSNELTAETLIESELRESISSYKSAVMLARLQEENGLFTENLRVVVVPDSWPER